MGASLPFSAFAAAASTDICPWPSASASADSFCSPPTGFSGRSCILGEFQSGLCLYGLGLPSLAGPGDSILAKECCVTQYGACESAGKHRITHYPLPASFRTAQRGMRSASLSHRLRLDSVAMPEQIEKSHSSPFGRAAQLSRLSFTQSVEVQRVGAAVPCALGDTRLVKRKASADRTQGPPSWVSTYSGAPRFPSMPSPTTSAQHAIGIKVWRMKGIFRATVFVLSLIGAIDRLNAAGSRIASSFASIVMVSHTCLTIFAMLLWPCSEVCRTWPAHDPHRHPAAKR